MGGHPTSGWHRFALVQRPSGLSRESAPEVGQKGATGGCYSHLIYKYKATHWETRLNSQRNPLK